MAASRRLSRAARLDQLVGAALPLVARHGPTDLSLDDVAERAGVTRNLLYHYFPGGRLDLLGAVVDEAEHQLTGPSGPADPGMAVSRLLDHALAPTHAWRIHRMARALPGLAGKLEASLRATTDALREFTGVQASLEAELILQGYVAYAEALLDGARAAGMARSDVRRLLSETLGAVVAAL